MAGASHGCALFPKTYEVTLDADCSGLEVKKKGCGGRGILNIIDLRYGEGTFPIFVITSSLVTMVIVFFP